MNWKFRAVAPDGSLVALDACQEEKIPEYHQALEAAVSSSVANPIFSGFHVRSSMGSAPAGNVEYGFCQALHSEEFAGAAFRSTRGYNSSLDVPVFGLAARASGHIPTPCGNCRDYLLDEFGPNLETVYGMANGGVAMVIPLRMYLADTYQGAPNIGLDLLGVQRTGQATLRQGSLLANDAFSPAGVHDLRRYAASVVTRRGQFFGGRQVLSDFHPIYALEDALRAAERHGDTILLEAFVASEGDGSKPPDVMYRDRQHLHDFNLQAELVRGCEQDPPVYLATCAGDEITGFWRTTVKQWLPRPFSARNFADMAKLEAYYKKRFPA